MLPSDGRRLTLLDCVGIGINGIVGSGIFFLPSIIGASYMVSEGVIETALPCASRAGGYSVAAVRTAASTPRYRMGQASNHTSPPPCGRHRKDAGLVGVGEHTEERRFHDASSSV